MLERLEELLRKDPFTPFRIIITRGSQYDVSSPLMLGIGKSEFAYYFPKSDRLAHIRLNQIAALETLDATV